MPEGLLGCGLAFNLPTSDVGKFGDVEEFEALERRVVLLEAKSRAA